MKAKMIRQIDVRQVRQHQLVFIIGRCQQHFVSYVLPTDVGPSRLYNSKVFLTHGNPEWQQSALHSLNETSWHLRCHVNSTRELSNNLCEMGHPSKTKVERVLRYPSAYPRRIRRAGGADITAEAISGSGATPFVFKGAVLGAYVVDHGEFVWGILVDDREGSVAVGGEGVIRGRIESVGVHAVADREIGDDFAGVGVDCHHNFVVAAGEEAAVLKVHGQA